MSEGPQSGDVFCVSDRSIPGWDSAKCRPCVVLSSDGAGALRVVPRTTHPRHRRDAVASRVHLPVFDRPGWFSPVTVLVVETDVVDYLGRCPKNELAALLEAVR